MQRRIFDTNGHAHFVTFSCYRRRRLLDSDIAKIIVTRCLSAQLKNQSGTCMGFVIMPDHVHALVHFKRPGSLSVFMNQWKRRSSMQLKNLFHQTFRPYGTKIKLTCPMWQRKYYAFYVFSENVLAEKLSYMHNNPVKSGLVKKSVDWSFSSAGWYAKRESVGVPITP